MLDDFNSSDSLFEQSVAENQMFQQNMMDMQQMQLMQQQQMLQQQQMMNMQQPMMQMQQGYPMQQGYQMQQGYPMQTYRYSKGQIIQGLRDYVIMQTQRVITREEKLEDTPQLLRHACVESKTKISQLGINQFNVPEMGISVPFYFCTACGKLYYYKDFMM